MKDTEKQKRDWRWLILVGTFASLMLSIHEVMESITNA